MEGTPHDAVVKIHIFIFATRNFASQLLWSTRPAVCFIIPLWSVWLDDVTFSKLCSSPTVQSCIARGRQATHDKYGALSKHFFRLTPQAYKDAANRYRLFWPDRAEFVRIAAKYNALIFPFAAVGAEDHVTALNPTQLISQLSSTLQHNPVARALPNPSTTSEAEHSHQSQ